MGISDHLFTFRADASTRHDAAKKIRGVLAAYETTLSPCALPYVDVIIAASLRMNA